MYCNTYSLLIFMQIHEGVGQGGLEKALANWNGHNFLNIGPIYKILKVAYSI